MTDIRSRILAAIDALQRGVRNVAGVDVMSAVHQHGESWGGCTGKVQRELRAMAKAGIVVYDRKAAGWRRV